MRRRKGKINSKTQGEGHRVKRQPEEYADSEKTRGGGYSLQNAAKQLRPIRGGIEIGGAIERDLKLTFQFKRKPTG